jgi:hypothetical protein
VLPVDGAKYLGGPVAAQARKDFVATPEQVGH